MTFLVLSRRRALRSRGLVPALFAALLLRALAPHGVAPAASAAGFAGWCEAGLLRPGLPATPRGERPAVEHALCGHGGGPCASGGGSVPMAPHALAPLVAAACAACDRAAAGCSTTLPPARAPPRAGARGGTRGLLAAA